MTVSITNVGFQTARHQDVCTGLLGWVTCTVNDSLMLDGITLRRTRGGRLTLSFPSRTDGAGQRHFVIRPTDDDARRHIETQVFAKLGINGETAS